MLDDAALYDQAYFAGYYFDDPKRTAMYKIEAARLGQRSEPGRILEIGCGVGGFLKTLDDRWQIYGYEPSAYARAIAGNCGIRVFYNLESVTSDSMDVVVFRGTLQHISRLLETMAQATRILRPGGLIVFLATPDADSLAYQLFGRLPALDPARNWIVLGHRALVNILKRLGYSEIEILYPYWGTPYARPLQDFVNFGLSFFQYRKFAFPGNMMEVYAWRSK